MPILKGINEEMTVHGRGAKRVNEVNRRPQLQKLTEDLRPKDEAFLKRRVSQSTPLKKANRSERTGRKAMGLRTETPTVHARQAAKGGLTADRRFRKVEFKGGSPRTLSSTPEGGLPRWRSRPRLLLELFFYPYFGRWRPLINMAFADLLVTEIFHSLQGETSLSGKRFAFVRLTGCNLRCNYCDSAYAFKGGVKLSISQILDRIRDFQVEHVLLTGGEPLLQRNTIPLISALNDAGYTVSVETHGELSIEAATPMARIIMDIKTPSSGMARQGFIKNLPLLKAGDEVKLVIASSADYEWAKEVLKNHRIPTREILFSPALNAQGMPGTIEGVSTRWLGEKILADRLPVRLQIQLHKLIWGADQRGV